MQGPSPGKQIPSIHFLSQGCIACHVIDLKAEQKDPYLGAAGAKFQRDYLVQSVLDPNAVVAQVSGIKRSDVEEETHLLQSMMPPDLANPLGIGDFTDLIEYLVSLKNGGG